MARRTSKVWKRCKCGRSYSKSEWANLHYVGPIVSETEKMVFTLEMRNCLCGSSITIERRQRKRATSPARK